MKILIVLSLIFFSQQTFAFQSCQSLFAQKKEQQLNVVELAANYHQNYLNSREGKANLERMQDLLNAKFEIKKYNVMPYYQVSFAPKNAVKESVLEEIILTNPNITIIYDFKPTKKKD